MGLQVLHCSKAAMRKPAKNLLLLGVLFGLPFGGWVFWIIQWSHAIEPAGAMLADHLERRRAPDQGRVFTVDGQEHLALIGPLDPFPKFPSGPPIYVFDDTGRFID